MPFIPTYVVPEERQAYTMEGGDVGCLVLHGFMGSPASTRPMAAYLSERGVTVHCPLLPGHGEYPRRLQNLPFQDWVAEAEEGLAFLRNRCDQIVLFGHSMGTILGALLVRKFGEIRGQIMIAPIYDVPDKRIRYLRALRFVIPWFYPLKVKRLRRLVNERLREFNPEIDLEDPDIQAKLPEMTKVPTSGMDEMRKVVDLGQDLWPLHDIPVRIFQGELDYAADPENTEKLYNLLPNKDKVLERFTDAGHELMRPFEPVHTQVWSKTYQFILSHTSLEHTARTD
jgi:carboxylesterase